ncbi:MAG: hypothetical protein H6819_08760 [Phycisphaerales bacterium]|nr:hypothetical protein [Phycisphaerales bacterium]MCB9855678.1 hypothetical protein [Phycisphaerales bacterium]MCB9862573.1 hypothetical protein [Phycisphaerales bacterium]
MRRVCTQTLGLIVAFQAVAVAYGQDPVTQYPRGWYRGMQSEAASTLEKLAIAYELKESQQAVVIDELDGRIMEQWSYMQEAPQIPEPANGEDVPEEKAKEILGIIADFYSHMPMNPDRIADWLENESGILEPGQAPLGRTKFNELRYRDYQFAATKTDDPEINVKISRELKLLRSGSIASSNAAGDWLPAGTRAPSQGNDHYSYWKVAVRPTRSLPTSSTSEHHADAAMQPLPCFGTWREAARKICARSHQREAARIAALWSEFTTRAWRRIAMDGDTFDELQQLTSNSRVAEVLVERNIQTDLDALFLEFQIRLKAVEAECKS